jgi:hypothetical protein
MKHIIKIATLFILLSSCSINNQLTDVQKTRINKSNIYNKPTKNLNPRWYIPQQIVNTSITPMVTPQFIFQGENGRGYSGPNGF